MTYYDRIAKQWHAATGQAGGAFKQLVLNDVLLNAIPGIHDQSILELGAGNGYFARLMLKHFSGQRPEQLVVTDQSDRLLDIAQQQVRVPGAEYQPLDVVQPFPFEDGTFDLILASMLFNEVASPGFRSALGECHRVLARPGLLFIAVTHPKFINSLRKRDLLTHAHGEVFTMPGAGNLKLPVVIRSVEAYRRHLAEAGFQFEEAEVFPSPEVLNAKAGLRHAGRGPLALVFRCNKPGG